MKDLIALSPDIPMDAILRFVSRKFGDKDICINIVWRANNGSPDDITVAVEGWGTFPVSASWFGGDSDVKEVEEEISTLLAAHPFAERVGDSAIMWFAEVKDVKP